MAVELDVRSISTRRGTAQVLFDVDLSVATGESVGVIGRNGVGKTTLLRSIVGLSPPFAGEVLVRGTDVAGWPAHKIARLGVRLVPDHRGIIGNLTVGENLRLFADSSGIEVTEEAIDLVYATFPELAGREKVLGARLSGGQQQMLAVARSMVANPQVLILDEPFEGLAPQIVAAIGRALGTLRQRGVTLLLVEQSLRALQFVDTVYILDRGTVVYQGEAKVLRERPDLLQRHLGVSA